MNRVILVALLALAACTVPPTGPSEPIEVNVCSGSGGCANNTTPTPSPSASPTVPGVPNGSAPATVRVTQFGEDCPAGVTPSGQNRQVRVGCRKILTCTPRLADGSDAVTPLAITRPDSFGPTTGAGNVQVERQDNPFNLDARATSPGTTHFTCVVRGVSSDSTDPFDLVVVP